MTKKDKAQRLASIQEIREVCERNTITSDAFFTDCLLGGKTYILRIRWRPEKISMVAELVTEHAVEGHAVELRLPKAHAGIAISSIIKLLHVKHVVGIVDEAHIPINELPPFKPKMVINKKPVF